MSDKTKKTSSFAVALSYDGDTPPIVTATGHSETAEQIIEIGKQAEVPVFEDCELAALLSELDLGDHIPRPLFSVIAEVLSFAYMLSGKHKEFMDKKK